MVRTKASSSALLIAALLFATAALLTARATERFTERARFTVAPAEVRLITDRGAIAALDADAFSELRALEAPRNLFEKSLADDVRRRIEAHPLVREVVQIDRRWQGSLDVRVALRTHYVHLRVGAATVALDRDGVVLTRPRPYEEGATLRAPVIESAAGLFDRLPPRGTRLFDRNVPSKMGQALSEVYNLLDHLQREEPQRHAAMSWLKLDRIRIGSADTPWTPGSPSLTILPKGYPEFFWGHCPDALYGTGARGVIEKLGRAELARMGSANFLGRSWVDLTLTQPESFPAAP